MSDLERGKRSMIKILLSTVIVGTALLARGHFQVLLPSAAIVEKMKEAFELKMIFTHPMEQGPVMEMGKPKQFGVLNCGDGSKINLLDKLKSKKLEGKTAYNCSYQFKMPGDYIFYLEPAPY